MFGQWDDQKPGKQIVCFRRVFWGDLSKPSFRKTVAGGHRKLHCISVKQNLFHQCKWSRAIGLNTKRVILFKSPRDLSQIYHFGRQLKRTGCFWEAYQSPTTSPFRHLLIDFESKTSDALCFCWNIVAPHTTIFCIPQISLPLTRLPSVFHHQLQRKRFWQMSEENCIYWSTGKNMKTKGVSSGIHDFDEEKSFLWVRLNFIIGNISMDVNKLVPFE